ncbi:DUF1843 domain-containing protein [Azospirillaceae bacterium]
MKKLDLIMAASAGYPDDLVLQAFKTKDRVGDGLAEFIANELSETFVDYLSTTEQLKSALTTLVRASEELSAVIVAIEEQLKEEVEK